VLEEIPCAGAKGVSMRKESNSRCRYRGIRLMCVVAIVLTAAAIGNAQSGTADESSGRPRIVNARRVFVRSTSLLVRGAVVEDKLLKNSEFKQLGFVITRDPRDADLVLELRHDLLTMYVFTVVEVKTMTVIAGGKLSSVGGTVAGKVARRFVKEMSRG
jgi:hypothetical protein